MTLAVLLRHVKPGGIFILEDMHTSFREKSLIDRKQVKVLTTFDFVQRMVQCMQTRQTADEAWEPHSLLPDPCVLSRLVESVTCYEEIYVFKRWSAGDQRFEREGDSWFSFKQRALRR